MATIAPPVTSTASFSPCRRYRYSLRREWDTGSGEVLFLMLNPSTADASKNDPTIRRCIGFARDWGYRVFSAANIFALRSTDARGLGRVDDPVGPGNRRAIRRAAQRADLTILAWGTSTRHAAPESVARALSAVAAACTDRPAACLGLTRDGHPRHPLYVPAATSPLPCTIEPAHEKGAARSDRPFEIRLLD